MMVMQSLGRSARRPSLAVRRCFLVAAALSAVLASLLLSSCGGGEKPSVALKREQLFALGYGSTEDQLDLFQVDRSEATQKTCITMREGIFYISNGAGGKVVRYSSFGDPLSMIYNPAKNPAPIVLKTVAARQEKSPEGGISRAAAAPAGASSDDEGLGRKAVPYAFRSAGEIAVDSNQTVYVEDRLPPERRVQDKGSDAVLDRVILRFGKDGQFIDYLGQEGSGGTPFPYILGLYTTASDDCVVVSILQSAWLVHWFDKSGVLASSLRLSRDELPMPEKAEGLIANLDKIVPDSSGKALILKIDYYRASVDPTTKAEAGTEFASSWVYRMDLKDGKYSDRWQIHAMEKSAKLADGKSIKYSRVPELLGATGRNFYLIYADDDGKTYVSTYDRTTRDTARFSIDISPDEMYYNAYYLSPSGVLCALLGTKYEARIVWWRFDKQLGTTGSGLVK
jgi:hypothetical protein